MVRRGPRGTAYTQYGTLGERKGGRAGVSMMRPSFVLPCRPPCPNLLTFLQARPLPTSTPSHPLSVSLSVSLSDL